MKLLCITDPSTHPSFDTTLSLYRLFAASPDIEFFHAPVSNIDASGYFHGAAIDGDLSSDDFAALDKAPLSPISPSALDLVFNRADEPVPEGFYQHLSQLENAVKFVNRPSQVSYTRHKSFLEDHGREHLPDHIFSSSYEEIAAFFRRFDPMVAKSNVSYGGKGVYKIWQQDGGIFTDNVQEGRVKYDSLRAVLDHLFKADPDGNYEFVRYLKNIGAGDKRILVVDGEVYGAFLRKATRDTWVHNVTAGASYTTTTITDKELAVVDKTCGLYHSRGVYTLGYDFLMDDDGTWTLSEINAGNIGGYDWLEEITGEPILDRLIQWMTQFVARGSHHPSGQP